MAVLSAIGLYLYNWSRSSESQVSIGCNTDDDCIVFGKTGDCNCGCYSKNNLPNKTGGNCFCQVPTSCRCVEGQCIGVFEQQASSEEVSQSVCGGMSLEKAKEIASQSECGSNFKNAFVCNEYTNTWWIDLDIEKEGCSPACVVNTQTAVAEINWRCTGLLPQD